MSRQRSETFLLRIILEEQQEGHIEEWMGRVQHVPSGKASQFSGAQELVAFVNAMRAETVAAAKDRPQER